LDTKFKIYKTQQQVADVLALDLVKMIKKAEKRKSFFTIALSGGNTPKLFFSVLAEKLRKSVDLSIVHIFWSDERCVPPDDPESNFGMTSRLLLKWIEIPKENIHRIRGEEAPEKEVLRYSEEIMKYNRHHENLPVFDMVVLGMGEDGHTASIFPENPESLFSEKLCEVTVHPLSGQKRVTMTGKVINNADEIIFLVTGENKAQIIEEIFKKGVSAHNFPASYIIPLHGNVTWMLDEGSGKYIR
jgi:6-phosphogluconolactonase